MRASLPPGQYWSPACRCGGGDGDDADCSAVVDEHAASNKATINHRIQHRLWLFDVDTASAWRHAHSRFGHN